MNNLIKAEWFRLRRTGIIKYILLINVIAILFQFIGDDGMDINAYSFFKHGMLGISTTLLSTTGFVCGTFNDRTANYEVMKGTPPILMILYRIIISLILISACYFLPTVILIKVFDGAKLTLPMILLLFVCITKLTVFFVAMCVIFSGVTGIVLAAFMVAFNTMPLVILQNIAHIDVVPLTSYLTSTQLMLIGDLPQIELERLSMPLDASNIEIKVIASFVVLSAVMILIAYKLLKDRKQLGMIEES